MTLSTWATRSSSSATKTAEAAGMDPDSSRSRRTVTGRLKVRAMVVGGAVERAIVSGLSEHLADEVGVVDRYLADATR